jgi:hypothetical protein
MMPSQQQKTTKETKAKTKVTAADRISVCSIN